MCERYARQLQSPDIGLAGRTALQRSSVTVIGAGGLGSFFLLNITGLGVGRICLVDGDIVSISNLDRQILYTEKDLGKAKAISAQKHLQDRNHDIRIHAIDAYLCAKNIEQLLSGTDLVVLAADNADDRKLVNQFCCVKGIPLLNGGVNGMYGSVQLVIPNFTACLSCSGAILEGGTILPTPAPVVSWTASIMAQYALLFLLGRSEVLWDKIVYLDGNCLSQEFISIRRSPSCPFCNISIHDIP